MQNSTYLPLIFHVLGNICIFITIILIHPIENDRESDITTASSLYLSICQITMPLGLTLNFIPMCLNRSVVLRSIMTSSVLKPISHLIWVIIPLSGTLILHIVYNQTDGMYTDFRQYIRFSFALLCYLILISLLISFLFVSPMTNLSKILFEDHRFQSGGRGLNPSKEGTEDPLVEETDGEGEESEEEDDDTNGLLDKKPEELIDR
jgi:hypothetical protein